MNTESIKSEIIIGARRLENYLWCIIICSWSLGFIAVSLSSFYKKQLLPFVSYGSIKFFPQGVLMLFYGIMGLVLSIYILLLIVWDIGGGYNEFDKKCATIRLVRRGFPGPNRKTLLIIPMCEINAIEVQIKEGINLRRSICLVLNDERRIALTGLDQPLPLSEIEEKAITLAKFLNIPYNLIK